MEDTNLRAMLGGPAKLGLQPTLPWLTVNFRQNQNEGGSEVDEGQSHKWCICDRNPSSCLIHAGSSTTHWPQSSEISLARPQFVADHFRDGEMDTAENSQIWKTAKMKADVLAHPLYQQLLAAHVACLRIATPVEQLPSIDAQLAQSQQIVAKYSPLADASFGQPDQDKDERDQFMSHYVLLLCSFKEQLQQHVRVHAMEAVMACWELEQSFSALTGVSPGEGSGVTMSDDEDDLDEGGGGFYDPGFDLNDSGGFGPLIPTENERSLMERVRQELKSELKQGYKERIIDVRDEILRKRRAGKLPGDTTTTLKAWWEAHSKWPYPTEDEKSRLVHETGLQLKQINNWFINQRKRNWHSNSSVSSKSKRKR